MEEHDLERLEGIRVQLQEAPTDPDVHRSALSELLDISASSQEAWDHPVVRLILERLFEQGHVWHQSLARITAWHLRAHHGLSVGGQLREQRVNTKRLSEDRLLHLMLQKSFVNDLTLEAYVKQLRKSLLFEHASVLVAPAPPLAFALAHHGWNNDYLYGVDEEEQGLLDSLEQRVLTEEFSAPQFEIALVLLAMYRPLEDDALADRGLGLPSEEISPSFGALIQSVILEPRRMRELQEQVGCFVSLQGGNAALMREQYEEHPFPRCFYVRPGRSLSHRLRKRGADLRLHEPSSLADPLRILVPGCGTGSQPIRLAASNPAAQVWAIDLSRRSLTYGMHKAEELNVANVRFLHGNLLNLHELGLRFHHVECAGVLHHLEDPMAGLEALENHLLPTGTMRICVYSKVARMSFQYLREEISRRNIGESRMEMIAFRKELIEGERYRELRKIVAGCRDFYNLTEFRDLLFNASECQFTVTRIEQMVGQLDLRLLTYRLPAALRSKAEKPFAANGFDGWKAVVQYHANDGEMFDFWLQKPPEQS